MNLNNNLFIKMTIKPKPLSPHIGIYKPQISSVLSILHRISGIASFVLTMMIAWCIILSSLHVQCHKCIMDLLHSNIGIAMFAAWTYALCFHFATGVRHMFWDMGYGFKISTMTKSGYFAVTFATAAWALLWAYISKTI